MFVEDRQVNHQRARKFQLISLFVEIISSKRAKAVMMGIPFLGMDAT